eukprot:CAMPEP_0170610820 /NCGR_PEP_ID=MMETSP0224-20130122/22864_1 /TAXON_ID=285029 /ORGANISM="Togula jolla, Strain CCCM 725" /LENGTH=519 /DNA_ID=CAMNT_0010936223 /DNA_START=145 /DNA_END=1705 /DNA_ORIENTATION=-
MLMVVRLPFMLLISTKSLVAGVLAPVELPSNEDCYLNLIQKNTFSSLENEDDDLHDLHNHTGTSSINFGHETALGYIAWPANSGEEPGNSSAERVNGSTEIRRYLLLSMAVTASIEGFSSAGLALVIFGIVLILVFTVMAFLTAQEDQSRCEEAAPKGSFRQQVSGGPMMSKTSSQRNHARELSGPEGRAGKASPYASPLVTRTEDSFPPSVSSAAHDRKAKAARTPTKSPYLENLQALGKPSIQMNPRMSNSAQVADLPLLCPALVLPHSEAWFAVSFEKLHQALSVPFELFGLSGKPLLKVTPDVSSDERQGFSIATTPVRSPMLATVMAGSVGTSTSMQIKAAQGTHFGDLVQSSTPGRYSLCCGGCEALLLNFDTSTCSLCVITVKSSAIIAKACRSSDGPFFNGMDHLELRINRGVDPVLSSAVCLEWSSSAPPLLAEVSRNLTGDAKGPLQVLVDHLGNEGIRALSVELPDLELAWSGAQGAPSERYLLMNWPARAFAPAPPLPPLHLNHIRR